MARSKRKKTLYPCPTLIIIRVLKNNFNIIEDFPIFLGGVVWRCDLITAHTWLCLSSLEASTPGGAITRRQMTGPCYITPCFGALDGRYPCRISILRKGNAAICRCCLFSPMSHVQFKKQLCPMSLCLNSHVTCHLDLCRISNLRNAHVYQSILWVKFYLRSL